jgi:hypothetical protein
LFYGTERLLSIFLGDGDMEITITIKCNDKDLEKVKMEEEPKQKIESKYSMYARVFDESCAMWSSEREYVLTFLKLQEEYANAKLRRVGCVFLNEIYDMLGMARTKAGQVVGWIYDEKNPVGDNRIDFGLEELYDRGVFDDDSTKPIWLDFNVDGMILDKIERGL